VLIKMRMFAGMVRASNLTFMWNTFLKTSLTSSARTKTFSLVCRSPLLSDIHTVTLAYMRVHSCCLLVGVPMAEVRANEVLGCCICPWLALTESFVVVTSV